jgi:hypothetical protein
MAKKKSQDYAKFIKWMWDQRDDVDMPFHVKSVTSEGSRKATFPGAALSRHEAEGLFRFLESKNLVTVEDRDDDEAVYSLNVVEHYKWGEVISDLSKSDFRRSWFYLRVLDGLFWMVPLVIAAFLGAVIKQKVDRLTIEPKTGQTLPSLAPITESSPDIRADDEDRPKPDDSKPDHGEE